MKRLKEIISEAVMPVRNTYTTNYHVVHGSTFDKSGAKYISHEFLADDHKHAEELFKKKFAKSNPRVSSVRRSSEYVTHHISKKHPDGVHEHAFKFGYKDGVEHVDYSHTFSVKGKHGDKEGVTMHGKMSHDAAKNHYKQILSDSGELHEKRSERYTDPRDKAESDRYGHKHGYTGD